MGSPQRLREISPCPAVPALEAGHHSQGEIMKSCNRYTGIDPYLVSQVRYRARKLSRHALMRGVEIEDIEQDLMLDLLSRKASYDPERAQWSTFVDRVLSNKCATLISAELAKKRGGGRGCLSLDGLLPEPIDEASLDPASVEIRIDLDRQVADLPPSLTGLLCGLGKNTMTEIARATGVPKTTLYDRLADLRARLQPLHDYLH